MYEVLLALTTTPLIGCAVCASVTVPAIEPFVPVASTNDCDVVPVPVTVTVKVSGSKPVSDAVTE